MVDLKALAVGADVLFVRKGNDDESTRAQLLHTDYSEHLAESEAFDRYDTLDCRISNASLRSSTSTSRWRKAGRQRLGCYYLPPEIRCLQAERMSRGLQ